MGGPDEHSNFPGTCANCYRPLDDSDLKAIEAERDAMKARAEEAEKDARECHAVHRVETKRREEAEAQAAAMREALEWIEENEGHTNEGGAMATRVLKESDAGARLVERLRTLEDFRAAYDRCDSSRGAFSCCERHDSRCPKSRDPEGTEWKKRNGSWECECGRDELDAAEARLEALDKETTK